MFKWRPASVLVIPVIVLLGAFTASCVRNPPPVTPDAPAPPPGADTVRSPPPSPPPAPEPPPVPPGPPVIGTDDEFASRDLEALNRDSPLDPVFFAYDSFDLDVGGRRMLDANAEVLRRYPTWVVTIEGHCDERGTAEYNLGLGERRALAAREYLLGQGLQSDRLRTVSYGKEFPFDPSHDESAWSTNRRAHFVITAR